MLVAAAQCHAAAGPSTQHGAAGAEQHGARCEHRDDTSGGIAANAKMATNNFQENFLKRQHCK